MSLSSIATFIEIRNRRQSSCFWVKRWLRCGGTWCAKAMGQVHWHFLGSKPLAMGPPFLKGLNYTLEEKPFPNLQVLIHVCLTTTQSTPWASVLPFTIQYAVVRIRSSFSQLVPVLHDRLWHGVSKYSLTTITITLRAKSETCANFS